MPLNIRNHVNSLVFSLGRKSHADQIIEELKDIEDTEGPYLVIYDFERKTGKPTHYIFFKNLNRILQRFDARRIQYSTIECNRLKAARAIELLAKRFNVRDIVIYEVKKIPLLT